MNQTELKRHIPLMGKHFLRMLKRNGLYGTFLKKCVKPESKDFNSMIEYVIKASEEDMRHHSIEDDYGYIMCVLNRMLHIYVEKNMGIHPQNIEKLGQEVFDSFCTELFGAEKFHSDMEKQQQQTPRMYIHMLKHMHEKLSNENPYFNLNFEDFVGQIRNMPKKEIENDDNSDFYINYSLS